ncbi:hypothetical protein BN1723_009189, partial [Verticillium longisporum]
MAEPSPAAGTQKLSLSAQYSHPTDTPFTAEASTDGPSSTSTADKSAFLARLRDLVTTVQADVNTQLTQKMEEDKQRAADVGGSAANGKGAADEAKEEENYGEELPEED